MSALAPSRARAASGSARWGFIRAVRGRLTWRFACASAPTGIGLWLVVSTNWVVSYSRPSLVWLTALITVAILTSMMMVAVLAADEAVLRGARRVSAYVTAVGAGAAAGAITQFIVLTSTGLPIWGRDKRWEIAYTQPAFIFLQTVLFGGLAVFIYVNVRSSIAATRARHAAELAHVQARRRTFESQLQAMQARVEPQFLFNTLAHVRALYERNPEQAGGMLGDLITYLRAALPSLRESSSTLGKEVELVRAYLNIMQLRLGDRLASSFDVPEAQHDARFPPMLLLPLIDRVLVQALGPESGPATLTIIATVRGRRLRVSVAHSGDGFMAGGGAAELKDIGERVDSLHGDNGSFMIERTPTGGTRATIEVPHEIANDDHR